MKTLKRVNVRSEKIADYQIESRGKIKDLKKNSYCVVEGYSIGGEAPKSFIKVYEHQNLSKSNSKKANKKLKQQKKANTKTWTLYIAKAGHKWYPIESITEHLIARIGSETGLNMAHSRLAKIDNQVRFLSKYFIDPYKQELVHGTDILAAYVDDRPFIHEIQKNKREPEFFTLETVVDAIKHMFPEHYNEIIEQYFLMLIFDAWVGVQDRHFDNWAVVRSIYGTNAPYFSPIYDSARGLFWNEREEKIIIWYKYKQLESQIERLINTSMPQVGIMAGEKTNHFRLIEEILSDKFIPIKSKASTIFSPHGLAKTQKMIEAEFDGLLSKRRIYLINKCLHIRYLKLKDLFVGKGIIF